MMILKQTIKKLFNYIGYDICRTKSWVKSIPDVNFYRPFFSPWRGYGDFKRYHEIAKPFTLVWPNSCYVLYILALQSLNLDGQWYEAGVYKGGTAMLLAKLLEEKARHKQTRLHLFDTFEGMPETDPRIDILKKGTFKDTSLETVMSQIRTLISDFNIVEFHKGFIPATFNGLESHHISFAHIDVDLYRSVIDCCNFIYPRLQNGGFMVFDDYGLSRCPGARKAVDEFFREKHEMPLVLPTGQAIVFRTSTAIKNGTEK